MCRAAMTGMVLIYASPAAFAESYCGPPEVTRFHCEFDEPARQVSVCLVPGLDYHYRYGKPGEVPELDLARSLEQITFQPWNGIGDTFWASVTFRNEGYSYRASYHQLKQPGAPLEGTLEVMKDDKVVSHEKCVPGTVVQTLDEME